MEWLILILLVPLVLLPVIALSGFAGCDRVFGLRRVPPAPPDPPSDLRATATGTDRIELSWTDNSTSITHYRIRRSDDGGMSFALIGEIQAPETTYPDAEGLMEGEYYEYQVFGFVNGVETDGSNIDGERTLAWTIALNLATNAAVDGAGRAGRCLVQRFPGSLLSLSGSAVRITVRGSDVGDLRLDAVTISRAAPAGAQEWDSIEQPVGVTFRGGSAGILVGAMQSEPSDGIPYTFEAGQDLIVAFDIGSPGQVRRWTGVAGAQAYSIVNPPLKQAGEPNRVDGFTTEPSGNTVFIVEKIEVLVKVPD